MLISNGKKLRYDLGPLCTLQTLGRRCCPLGPFFGGGGGTHAPGMLVLGSRKALQWEVSTQISDSVEPSRSSMTRPSHLAS